MGAILEGLGNAFLLILCLDAELLGIISLSLKVSGLALIFATAGGLALSAFMGFRDFPLKRLLINIMNTFTGLPPVAVGLFLYLILSRSGPLGFMGLLYTPSAMVAAQTILAFPIVVSIGYSAIVGVDPIIRQSAATLGAKPLQVSMAVIREARYGIMAGVIAAFGRVMAEVGAIIIVGGNIAGYTRVMTTTIALETDKGNFELAVALGIILLSISFVINLLFYIVQKKGFYRR